MIWSFKTEKFHSPLSVLHHLNTKITNTAQSLSCAHTGKGTEVCHGTVFLFVLSPRNTEHFLTVFFDQRVTRAKPLGSGSGALLMKAEKQAKQA